MLKLTRQYQFCETQIVHVKRESERENKCDIVVRGTCGSVFTSSITKQQLVVYICVWYNFCR